MVIGTVIKKKSWDEEDATLVKEVKQFFQRNLHQASTLKKSKTYQKSKMQTSSVFAKVKIVMNQI